MFTDDNDIDKYMYKEQICQGYKCTISQGTM